MPPKKRSVIGAHVCPPSVVFITPLPVVPNQYSLGLATLPAAATDRPPRGGPTSRHRSPPNTAESSVMGAVGAGGTARATGRAGGDVEGRVGCCAPSGDSASSEERLKNARVLRIANAPGGIRAKYVAILHHRAIPLPLTCRLDPRADPGHSALRRGSGPGNRA